MKTIISCLLLLLSLSTAFAQTTKRKAPTRKPGVETPQPQPTPAPVQPPRKPVASSSVVTVNGQTFATADLPPALREELDRVDDKIAEARSQLFDLQINTMLLQLEAKKRGIDTHRLYELEVSGRLPTITQTQIKKFIDENRGQFEGIEPAVANQQVAAFLRAESESKLADDLVKRLRKTYPVVMGVDINSPTLNGNSVIATVAEGPLKADSLIERLKPIVYKLKLEAYELTKKQADQFV